MERLVFNTEEHKLEELEKYGFVKLASQYVLDFIKYHKYDYSYLFVEIDDYKVLDFTYVDLIYKSINCNTNGLYIKVSVYSYEQCEDDFISKDYDFYVQDLIKDGLVIKEKKDERNHCN